MQHNKIFQMKQKRFEDPISKKMHKILYYKIFQHKSYHICCAVVSMRPMALNYMIGPSSSGKGDEVNPK